jgi:hypothetical protein
VVQRRRRTGIGFAGHIRHYARSAHHGDGDIQKGLYTHHVVTFEWLSGPHATLGQSQTRWTSAREEGYAARVFIRDRFRPLRRGRA